MVMECVGVGQLDSRRAATRSEGLLRSAGHLQLCCHTHLPNPVAAHYRQALCRTGCLTLHDASMRHDASHPGRDFTHLLARGVLGARQLARRLVGSLLGAGLQRKRNM